MPLNKEQMREYQRQRRKKVDKQVDKNTLKTPQIDVKRPPSVNPRVNPTLADVEAGKAWVALSGPRKGEIVWHGPVAQSWKNVPCQLVDGVCVADHGPNYHPHLPDAIDDTNPISDFISRPSSSDMPNLEKLQRVAGALGKLAGEVRFGIDGPTFEDLGETIGHRPAVRPK